MNENEKIDLNIFYAENEANGTVPISDESWCVGYMSDFTLDSLDMFGHILIEYDKVYVTRDIEENFWSLATAALAEDISDNLENLIGGGLYYRPFIIREAKSSIFGRNVEFGIGKNDFFPIYGQLSFSNEDISELLTDCVMFLTEYKSIEYSIGAKIDSSSNIFAIDIFVLKRSICCKPDSERTKVLSTKNYYAIDYKPKEKNKWDPTFNNQEIKDCFLNGNLSKFNVEIIIKKKISVDNLNEDLSFDLSLDKIQSGKSGTANFLIKSRTFKFIYGWWKNYREERSYEVN